MSREAVKLIKKLREQLLEYGWACARDGATNARSSLNDEGRQRVAEYNLDRRLRGHLGHTLVELEKEIGTEATLSK